MRTLVFSDDNVGYNRKGAKSHIMPRPQAQTKNDIIGKKPNYFKGLWLGVLFAE